MSLHPGNIEPSEGAVYLTALAQLVQGGDLPVWAQARPASVQRVPFPCSRLPLCTILPLPASASLLPLDCPDLPPAGFQHVLWTGWGIMLLPTASVYTMNFSWFPTRACEWVAWVFEIWGLAVLQDWRRRGF